MPKAREPLMAALTAELITMRVGSWVIEAIGQVNAAWGRAMVVDRSHVDGDHQPLATQSVDRLGADQPIGADPTTVCDVTGAC
jgi:hypothetical protein